MLATRSVSHGLHVSPRAPGDEISHTRVLPGETYEYTYLIPKDHMGGTFWYHPHFHGSTAIHVNFGAAGMIIIEDAEMQLPQEFAAVDSGGPWMEDHILVAYYVQFSDITEIANGARYSPIRGGPPPNLPTYRLTAWPPHPTPPHRLTARPPARARAQGTSKTASA